MKLFAVSFLEMIMMVALMYSRLRPIAAFSSIGSSSTRRISAWVPSTRVSNVHTARYSSTSSGEEGSDATAESKDDPLLEYRNKSNMRDQVFSAMSKDGSIKVTAATVRNAINDMMIQHTMNAVSADALGRTATCALLMSNGMQDEQTLQITMNSTLKKNL